MGLAQRKDVTNNKLHKRNIKVVRNSNIKKRANKRNNRFKKIILTTIFLSLLIVLLTGYAKITQINNDLMNLKKEVNELEGSRDYLMMELEPYKSTKRIEDIARVNLGMDYPTSDQFLYLNDEEKKTDKNIKLAEDKNEKLLSANKK